MVLALLLGASGGAGANEERNVSVAPPYFDNPTTTVFINEIHYDNTGGDTGEAIEIVGPAGTDLAGWSLVLYNGNGGAVDFTVTLSGVIPNQQGGYGTLSFATTGIQNGSPDGVALVDAGNAVIQFLSYEGTFAAVGGAADGLTSTDIGVSETGNEPVGESLQLTGLGTTYGDFTWSSSAANTFGSPNTGQAFDLAPTVINTSPVNGATNVAVDSNIVITFSEPVDVPADNSWFSILCINGSGPHTAAVTGGPTVFTLNPDTDFVTDENCDVFVSATAVTDQDTGDPPDNMDANYSFSFGTLITATPTRSLTPSRTPSPTRTPTPTPTSTPVRTVMINEVGWMGTSSSNTGDEWVELYGPPNMDVTGWRLVGGDLSPDITLAGSTDANGFFVIASNTSVFLSFTYGQVDSTLIIENTEESLQLFDDNGVLMDTVTPILISGVNRWPAGCGPSGYTCLTTNVCTKNSSNTNYASMERRGNTPDIGANWFTYASTPTTPVLDRNNKVVCGSPGQANWAYGVTATPSKTPSRTPTVTRTRTPTPFPTPIPIVVINEVMPRAGHDWNGDGTVDVYDEFIEIKNVGSLPANLSNYKLDDEKEGGSAPYTLRSLILDPGERAVFYGSETGILLSDGGDTVLLLNARGTIVDAYTYSIAEEPDRSFCRLFSNPGYWRENCFPTPGLENGYSGRYPPGPDGSHEPVCLMPDTAPDDFIEAECESAGLGIWNPEYWNTFPGEGKERWIPNENEKDPTVYN